jgi:hypothetical protein
LNARKTLTRPRSTARHTPSSTGRAVQQWNREETK